MMLQISIPLLTHLKKLCWSCIFPCRWGPLELGVPVRWTAWTPCRPSYASADTSLFDVEEVCRDKTVSVHGTSFWHPST